jgi:crossover junction endodeoxyribonuclease RusA
MSTAAVTLDFAVLNAHWISANDRLHWAEKARRTKVLRQYGHAVALAAGARDLGVSHVAAFIGYPRNGKADPANAAPTVKALIDGMVDAGAWPDDDSTYVLGPTYLRGEKCPVGQHSVRLVITGQGVPW